MRKVNPKVEKGRGMRVGQGAVGKRSGLCAGKVGSVQGAAVGIERGEGEVVQSPRRS